MYILSKL